MFAKAYGIGAQADGNFAMSSGYAASAKGANSVAKGHNAKANGQAAEALGDFAEAIGEGANAKGTWAESKGRGSIATGWGATSIGDSSIAQSNGATAIEGGTALSEGSFAKGNGAIVHSQDPPNTQVLAAEHQEEFPQECSICLSGIDPTSGAPKTDCGHSFHKFCLMKWIAMQKNNPSCPNCRSDGFEFMDISLISSIQKTKPKF